VLCGTARYLCLSFYGASSYALWMSLTSVLKFSTNSIDIPANSSEYANKPRVFLWVGERRVGGTLNIARYVCLDFSVGGGEFLVHVVGCWWKAF